MAVERETTRNDRKRDDRRRDRPVDRARCCRSRPARTCRVQSRVCRACGRAAALVALGSAARPHREAAGAGCSYPRGARPTGDGRKDRAVLQRGIAARRPARVSVARSRAGRRGARIVARRHDAAIDRARQHTRSAGTVARRSCRGYRCGRGCRCLRPRCTSGSVWCRGQRPEFAPGKCARSRGGDWIAGWSAAARIAVRARRDRWRHACPTRCGHPWRGT